MWVLLAALGYLALAKPKPASQGSCTCSVDPSCCADEAPAAPSRAQTMKTSLARKTGRYG
jgi:hypothetical protein